MTAGKMYIYGCLVCGALFGALSVFVSAISWSFGRLEKMAALIGVALFFGWCLTFVLSGKYRAFLKELIHSCRLGWSKWDTMCVAVYAAVASLYVSHPFYISDRFTVPEQVLALTQHGQLESARDKIAWLYACLCDWFGVGVYRVLFDAVPYAMLLLVFCVMGELAVACFGDKKHIKAYFLLVYALLTLFGNEAYMNPPYGLLHYPYEGMTLLSNVCVPLLLLVFVTRTKSMACLLGLVVMNAVIFSGGAKSGIVLGTEAVLLVALLIIFSVLERRKTR